MPDLVSSLGDEVCGEIVLKLLFVLEGVVGLGIGHGARLEPAVEDLRDAFEWGTPGPFGGDGDLVDGFPVKVVDFHPGKGFQFFDGADAHGLLAVF